MLKMIVFDMDGLLVDSEQVYQRGWIKVANDHGMTLTKEDMAGWSGRSLKQTQANLVALFGSEELVNQLRQEREAFIQEELVTGQLQLKPYAREVLQVARQKGLILALATSTYQKRAQHFLDYLDFGQYFDYLTFGDQVVQMKPDPEVYLTSLAKAGVAAQDAIAAEDSLSGALAATRAGLPVVFVPDLAAGNAYTDEEKAGLNILMEGASLKVLIDYLQRL